jgi:TIR domain
MGYHAPSAEEFYRYALRLDARPRLGDRFGFSIVLVNDSSAVCRDFLRSYCVDLCQRTADRIRFVFFSELSEDEVNDIVHDFNTGRRDARRGLLRSIVDLLGFRERYDLEREPWLALRPASLRPLRRLDDIAAHLSWQVDSLTAMPGAGVAMEFAQRLGIGRHVPCILTLTEVGDRHVHVLPIARLSPAGIFDRLRGWIDGFYEQNRAEIDHWEAVEKEIEELARAARLTLEDIREWRDEQLSAWRHLTSIAAAIEIIESGNLKRSLDLAKAQARDASAHPRLRHLLGELTSRLAEIDRRRAAGRRVTQAAEAAVATAATPELLLLQLEGWSERLQRGSTVIPDWSQAMVELRDRLARTPAAAAAIRSQLETWWRRRAHVQLPHQRFKSERSDWAHLLDGAARGRAHRALLAAMRELPLSIDPAIGVRTVLDAVANHLQLDPRSESWLLATASYRDLLQAHLEDTVRGAPAWLLAGGADLTFEEALPPPEDLRRRPAAALLSARPALRAVLATATARDEPAAAARRAEDEAFAIAWRERLVEKLRTRAKPRSDKYRLLFEDVLAALRQLRREVEAKADAALAPPFRREWPKLDHDSLAARLRRALDEYEAATQSVRFPHLEDPLLLRVEVAMPVARAARIHAPSERGPAKRLRSSLDGTLADEQKAARLAAQARRKVAVARPAACLATALRNLLSKDRLEAIAVAVTGGTHGGFATTVDRAVAEHQTGRLLQSLSEPELAELLQALTATDAAADPHPVAGRPALETAVLVALGLYKVSAASPADEAVRRLQAKIETDEYDVFLAHNARDKPAVLSIARRLRRAGIYPWVDVEQIQPGRWFQDVINAVIPRVKAAAIIFGKHGLGRWQALETKSFISQCVERGLSVVPVLLPGVDAIPAELPILKELHLVRFQTNLKDKQAFARLVWGISGERPPLLA